MKDYYSILGIGRDSSKEDMKKAYRKLSMEFHPDRNPDNKEAEERFKEINEAYSILSNDEKRSAYDNPHFNPFESMFGGFDPFMHMRQQRRKPDINSPRDGAPLFVEVELPMKTFLFGGKYRVNLSFQDGCTACGAKGFTKSESCDACNGSGFIMNIQSHGGVTSSTMHQCMKCRGAGIIGIDKCEVCDGRSAVVADIEVDYNIPPNVVMGNRFVMPGVGRKGINGGSDGDVVITVAGIKKPNIEKLSSEQIMQLHHLLEVLDNDTKSA